jgi:hypothetical protein
MAISATFDAVADDNARDAVLTPLERKAAKIARRIFEKCPPPTTWRGAVAASRAVLSESSGYTAPELMNTGDLTGWLARNVLEFVVQKADLCP